MKCRICNEPTDELEANGQILDCWRCRYYLSDGEIYSPEVDALPRHWTSRVHGDGQAPDYGDSSLDDYLNALD